MAPKTRYAAAGDLNIAYQTLGSGPIDLFFVPGIIDLIPTGVKADSFGVLKRAGV
jgi:hypothetical protein